MLRKALLAVGCLLLWDGAARGQACYSGSIGTAPIELAISHYSPGELSGAYVYTKFDTPIKLSGTLQQGVLTLTEKDAHGKAIATLTVPAFVATSPTNAGTWKNLATGPELPLTLTQSFVVEPGREAAWNERELLQANSLKNTYFKVLITKERGQPYPAVSGVKLLEKKTDRLVQQLPLACQLIGLLNVSVGDYNFDGLPDFAVFEGSASGPNTTSLYFLYDPATRQYVDSGFAGTSLEFNAQKKRIYERNSCCAGTSVTTAEYKVVRNRMVLLAQHCYKWDEKKHALVARKLSACQ